MVTKVPRYMTTYIKMYGDVCTSQILMVYIPMKLKILDAKTNMSFDLRNACSDPETNLGNYI